MKYAVDVRPSTQREPDRPTVVGRAFVIVLLHAWPAVGADLPAVTNGGCATDTVAAKFSLRTTCPSGGRAVRLILEAAPIHVTGGPMQYALLIYGSPRDADGAPGRRRRDRRRPRPARRRPAGPACTPTSRPRPCARRRPDAADRRPVHRQQGVPRRPDRDRGRTTSTARSPSRGELQDARPTGGGRSRCGPSSRRCSVALDAVFREHWGRVLATLVGMLGDIELAEEPRPRRPSRSRPNAGPATASRPTRSAGWSRPRATARSTASAGSRSLAEKTRLLARELDSSTGGSRGRAGRPSATSGWS